MIGPERHTARSGWIFLAPALLLIAVFLCLPVLAALLWMVAASLMPPGEANRYPHRR
jgi:ABC-type sugar transport system permease subunit